MTRASPAGHLSAPVQLSFYLEPRDSWRIQTLDKKREVLLDARFYRKTLAVEVLQLQEESPLLLARFTLRLEPPIDCTLTCRDEGSRKELPGYKAEILRRPTTAWRGFERLVPLAAHAMNITGLWSRFTPFEPVFAFLRQWLREKLDKRALFAASPFSDDQLWSVYALVAEDPTGRMAQMARICPGVITCCCGLERDDPVDHDELIRVVVEGRRLNHVLDVAADGWLASRGERKRTNAWKLQRIKIRRACAHVPWSKLSAPPPPVLVPEHIPPAQEHAENVAWYDAMDALDLDADYLELEPEAANALYCFVSRNIRTLWALAGNRRTFIDDVGFIGHYVYTTNTRLSPRANVQRIRHEARLDFGGGHILPDEPLPRAPLEHWKSPDGRVLLEQIVVAGDLHTESETMGHCVGSYDGIAVLGDDYFYRGVVDGVRVTVQVRRARDGSVELVEARHADNEEVRSEHVDLLAEMLTEGAWYGEGQALRRPKGACPARPKSHG